MGTVTKRMKVSLVVCMLVLATALLNMGRGRSFIAKSKKSKKFYLIKTKPARVRDYKMWKTRSPVEQSLEEMLPKSNNHNAMEYGSDLEDKRRNGGKAGNKRKGQKARKGKKRRREKNAVQGEKPEPSQGGRSDKSCDQVQYDYQYGDWWAEICGNKELVGTGIMGNKGIDPGIG